VSITTAYEDDWFLVVDKPAGLLSVPAARNEKYTLTNILNGELEKKGVQYRLHPCHRLDRETSGLMIYAKGKAQQKKMMDMFRGRLVHKKYIAFVQGKLPKPQGQIKYDIEGKSALTKYRVLEERSNFSLAEVTPLTGRTNQIRIHFRQIGHPLVGESKFAFRRDYALRFKRVCLHAEYLGFIHPVTGEKINLSVGLAKDLRDFLLKHA